MRFGSVLLVVLLAAAGSGVALVAGGRIDWPDRWNPWAPLAIDAPPDVFFRMKLARASRDPQACAGLLAQADVRFRPLPDRVTGPGCGFADAVRIERTGVDVGKAFDLSCRAALSLALWERHALQRSAAAHFGAPVARLQHYGSYACRNIGRSEGGRRSRHATADALDVAAFVLADGRRVVVSRDWDDDGARGRFLRDVFAGACRFFDGVLGPAYDAAHRDHFHFDRGSFRTCR
jgi:hypothetical protein